MSRLGTGTQGAETGAAHEAAVIPEELRSLLATISHQIDEADQRHTGLLQELRDRLNRLSHETESVRAQVPEAAGGAFARIESGLAQLAMRIDAVDDAQNEARAPRAAETPALMPAALRSAASPASMGFAAGSDQPRTPMQTSAIDPFDLVGEDSDSEPAAPWDEASAEALTRVYEESDAALVRSTPRSETPAPEEPAAPEYEPPLTEPTASLMQRPQTLTAPVAAGFGEEDRNWLDNRLSEIAARIEASLSDMKPGLTMEHLGQRFSDFEERMGSVLGDVATRTDVESLKILEGQITELAHHLEQTEAQLGRLDSIEQQLQAVIEHLSEQPVAVEAAASAIAPDLPDFKLLASSTAEEVAARFASTLSGQGGERRIDEMSGLLRTLMDDRRQSDEQTYSMLDTVQQAMIRLLDRIDALEVSQARTQTFAAHATDNRGQRATDVRPTDMRSTDFAPTAHEPVANEVPAAQGPQDIGAPLAAAVAATAAAAAPAMAPAPAAKSSAEKLRQDFIADAQRAKMRAAAAAAAEQDDETAAPVQLSELKAARGLPRPKMPAPEPEIEAELKPAASSRKLRLTALALCLVIAASGAALFAKSRKTAPPVAVPVASDVVPDIAVPSTAKPAEAPATAVAPKATPAPKAAEPSAIMPQASTSPGGAFESPADEPAAVPAPIPAPEASATTPTPPPAAMPQPMPAPPAAARGPETGVDSLGGIDGEIEEGGEIIEQKFTPPGAAPAPEGIVLQRTGRQPTAQELIHLQTQQNNAALSSRLGTNASRLSPAELMPEELAKVRAQNIAYEQDAGMWPSQMAAVPASLGASANPLPEIPSAAPAIGTPAANSLALPPASVGPLSLRIAAAKGDPSAAFEVGARLAEGKGTNQNFKEAITWYQRSASQGFAQAQYRLGTLYERGLGVKADIGRARMWYQRAAEQGNVKAMHNLAVLSAGRETGTPDYTSAAQWFQSAADHGLADSQYNLAVLHENGLGVAKDETLAYKWYALAARSGDKESARRRDAVAAALDPGKRAEADRMISGFAPKRLLPLVNDARVAGEDWKKRQGDADAG